MKKPFEVKEFETIISNPDYKNDPNYKYLDNKHFDSLINFIEEFEGSEDEADALEVDLSITDFPACRKLTKLAIKTVTAHIILTSGTHAITTPIPKGAD